MRRPLPPFSQWFVDVACERSVNPQPPTPPPEILDPANFLGAALHILSFAEPTRRGIDTLMDVLFGFPQLTPLLEDPATHQQSVLVPPSLAAHWQHIVLPAWDQHAAIRRAINETADTAVAPNRPHDRMHIASPASPAGRHQRQPCMRVSAHALRG